MAEAKSSTQTDDYPTSGVSQKKKRIRSEAHKAYLREYHKKHKEQIRERQKAYYTENREKRRAIVRRWSAKNKVRIVQSQRKSKLKKYGLQPNEYSMLLFLQGGGCAICGKTYRLNPNRKENLAVDHNHTTGMVRGLLCSHCNTVLGFMNDDPDLLRKAADYLEAIQ